MRKSSFLHVNSFEFYRRIGESHQMVFASLRFCKKCPLVCMLWCCLVFTGVAVPPFWTANELPRLITLQQYKKGGDKPHNQNTVENFCCPQTFLTIESMLYILYVRDNAKITPQQDDYHQFGFTLEGFICNNDRLTGFLRSYLANK